MKKTISIGIIAYNEEANIGRLIQTIRKQDLKTVQIKEIIIVSSGSTDRTNSIATAAKRKDKKIKLITQPKRKGKSSAVNLFLARAKSSIVVMMSADLLLEKNTLENLIKPFKNSHVGIVGSHPVPLNDPSTFMGYAAKLLWELHHEISLKKPKMGEMIAFRKVFKKIPVLSAVDETNVESLIRGQGYKAVYAPSAIVQNKGPETVREFIARRRHIYAGHVATKNEYSYTVSTLSGFKAFFYILKRFELSWRYFFWTPLVILLEIYGRLLGKLDYVFKLRSHTIWERTPSTKRLA